MKTSDYTSRIATIVYKNYTENVDMNNELFKQSELNALVKNDKDIIRVDYYINGKLVGNKVYTEKQAIAQILKMNATQGRIMNDEEYEAGSDWYARKLRNEKRRDKIAELYEKMATYRLFITKEGYNNSELPCMLCQDWEDFIG